LQRTSQSAAKSAFEFDKVCGVSRGRLFKRITRRSLFSPAPPKGRRSEEICDFCSFEGYPLSDNGPTASAEGDIFGFVDAPEGYEIELIEKARMVV
jgi:hypothetical protein